MHELADQALASREVRIRLDPHGSIHDPLPASDGLPDASVQVRMALLHPPVQMRLALQIAILWILVHQSELRTKGAHALAFGLRQRPQPGHVDVRVANHKEQWCRIAIVSSQEWCQPLARLPCRLDHVLVRELRVIDQREIL